MNICYLKKQDGSVYGPIFIQDVARWAAEGRVAPEDKVSKDNNNWVAAPEWPELEMHWLLSLPAGSSYGPVNIHVLEELLNSKAIPADTPVTNKMTGAVTSLADVLLVAPVAESAKIEALRQSLQSAESDRKLLKGAFEQQKKGYEEEKAKLALKEQELAEEVKQLQRIKRALEEKLRRARTDNETLKKLCKEAGVALPEAPTAPKKGPKTRKIAASEEDLLDDGREILSASQVKSTSWVWWIVLYIVVIGGFLAYTFWANPVDPTAKITMIKTILFTVIGAGLFIILAVAIRRRSK